MSRKDDLEQSIAEANDLIHAYQTQFRESESPKTKARARREIVELRQLVEGYQAELETLSGDSKPHEDQTQPPQPTHIDTGGGMYVAGSMTNEGVIVGRDQQIAVDDGTGDDEPSFQQMQRDDRGGSSHHKLRVFLCHASEDKAAVRGLYQQLLTEGADPWLDEEKIRKYVNWQEAKEKRDEFQQKRLFD